MVVLALDTSTNQGGVAILRDRDILARRIWTREKSHSEMLTATLQACLEAAGLQLHDIDRLAVGKGPGSFTGIRIAVNAGRTLGYANAFPIFAFDTMEILAAAVHPNEGSRLLAMVNAHKNLLYVSQFSVQQGQWVRTRGPEALTLAQIEQIVNESHICVGDGYDEFESLFSTKLKSKLRRDSRFADFPLPDSLARMALESTARPLVWNELQALYIRSSEAEEKLRETLKNRPGQ